MPSPAHEIAVARLGRDPSLLPALAERLLGKRPEARPLPVDSTVRFVDPAEVRPDLILGHGQRGPWDAIEVQRRVDRRKEHRWALLVPLLQNQRGRMGDLWVITASRRTATWARTACDSAGPNGTRSRVEPVVLLLGSKDVEVLLDEGRPSLAFFAAWAMQHRHGPEAEQVVERAMEVSDRLPDEALRRQQERDIMGVLDRRLADKLRERIMEAKKGMEPRWMREIRHEMFGDHEAEFLARGEAKGKREAVLLMLEGRGLSMTRAERAEILGCEDLAALDRWIAGSVKAASVRELLATPAPKKNGRRPGPAARNGSTRHRTARID